MNVIPSKSRKGAGSRGATGAKKASKHAPPLVVHAAPPAVVPAALLASGAAATVRAPGVPTNASVAGAWWTASPGNSECLYPENFHLVGGPMHQPAMSPTAAYSRGIPSPFGSSTVNYQDVGSQENEAIDVDDDDDDTHQHARSEVRLNWFPSKDERLCSAWVLHSTDPIEGNDRKGEQYWGDVTATYNNTTQNNRSRNRNQLKIRWDRIKKPVTEFQGYWNRISQVYHSGFSDDQLMDQALELFASEHDEKPFTLRHAWKVLRNERKWAAHVKKVLEKDSSSSTAINPAHVVNLEDNPAQRPMGHKKAKEIRNGKRKASDVSAGINEKLEKFIEASNKSREGREKMAEVQQNLIDKKLEAAQLAHKTAREKTKCKMLDSYRELMFASTSNLSDEALAERGKALECMRLSLFCNDD